MGTTTALRQEIKRRFIRDAQQSGFTLDERDGPTFWILRRKTSESVQLISLQWEKYGRPRFRIDFGTCPVEGLEFTGKHIEWGDMHPHWAQDAGSLQPKRGLSSRSWFRQDSSLLRRMFGAPELRTPVEVVDELQAIFPEIERYWAEGIIGKHIRLWGRSP